MPTKAEMEAMRNLYQASAKALGTRVAQAQQDLIKAQNLRQAAGSPNPDLDGIVDKAQRLMQILDDARRLNDDIAIDFNRVIETMP
jgi:hypothetical protein